MTQSDWELSRIFEQRIVQSDLNLFLSVSMWRWGYTCVSVYACVHVCVSAYVCVCLVQMRMRTRG